MLNVSLFSDGFAENNGKDDIIAENGKERKLKCSTEKSKHVAKNKKSAGKYYGCHIIYIPLLYCTRFF